MRTGIVPGLRLTPRVTLASVLLPPDPVLSPDPVLPPAPAWANTAVVPSANRPALEAAVLPSANVRTCRPLIETSRTSDGSPPASLPDKSAPTKA